MVSAEMTLRGLVALIKFPGVSQRARRTATGMDARASKRRAIQNSQESVRALAKRYSISQKTVAKWKQRETVADLPTGSKEAKSTVLSDPLQQMPGLNRSQSTLTVRNARHLSSFDPSRIVNSGKSQILTGQDRLAFHQFLQ